MDVVNLYAKWEKSEVLRDRVRSEKKLCIHPDSQRFCEPNRVNAVNNAEVLFPVIRRLKATEGWQLPHLEPLQGEISRFFEKLGVEIDDQQIYMTSIEVKKLLGFVKRRVKRREITKD